MHHIALFRRAHRRRQEERLSRSTTTIHNQPELPPCQMIDTKHDQVANCDPKSETPLITITPIAEADLEPPPYQRWMQIPDNSALPPPPPLAYAKSPTSNASADSADDAKSWCLGNPLYEPRPMNAHELDCIENGHINLIRAPTLQASITSKVVGTHNVRSQVGCEDSTVLTQLPLYTPLSHWPRPNGTRTIYFEIRILNLCSHPADVDAAIVLGFVAPPYPAWRLPGWERASVGVHGDDGHRYVDNNRGGLAFTTPFVEHETVGIGMTLRQNNRRTGNLDVSVYMTRNGNIAGGWDLHEERDADDDGDVYGLDGSHNLLGAVGFFGQVEFDISFRRQDWLYKP